MNKLLSVFSALTFIACADNSSEKSGEENKDQTTMNATTLSEEEKQEGFQVLLGTSTISGWHVYGATSDGSAWKNNDGVLYLDASKKENGKIVGGGDIVSDEEFENFHLKLEWKVDTNGNSGVMFYVNEDTSIYKKSYETGPEMQVLDNNGHPDAKIIKHRAGDLYDLISCSKETVKPALEWNQVEIKCVNGKLDFWLNGENVVSTQLWDDAWRTMIASSKFKQWPGFGTFKKGRICLQDHGDNVWYRNIRIKKI
jgi:hypothetical protein